MLKTFLFGLCMGTADIVPGISGGTIAFILGFYEKLLSCFRRPVPWSFLLPLLAGIATAFLTLASLFTYLLNHEPYRSYLYSAFMGLILASTLFCAKQIPKWKPAHLLALLIGALIAYLLTGDLGHLKEGPTSSLYAILCGAIAISAMLLPGISGSYLLNILGLYAPAIHALAKLRTLDLDAISLLASLLLGIVIGAVTFSRVITYLFSHYRNLTIALLTGFMIGALRAIWPFRNATHELILPTEFLLPTTLMLTGFALVFLLEWLASRGVSRKDAK